MKKGFSIIICCYNSAHNLRETLSHAAFLRLPPRVSAELLIVDNASTDGTATVARHFWEELKAPFSMRIVYEPEIGLSHARMKGIREAQYEYLLFCDDDNWLQSDYPVIAEEILSAHPEAGMLGGRGEGVAAGRIPEWVKAVRIYGCGAQAAGNGSVEYLYGAGMILRKQVAALLLQSGFDFILPDRQKTALTSGGDYELSYAVRLAGFTLLYDDRLRFKHFLPAGRFSRDYVERFIRESNQSQDILNVYRYLVYHPAGGLRGFYKNMTWVMLHHVKRAGVSLASYVTCMGNEEKRFILYFSLIYHRHRVFRSFASLGSVRGNYKEILHFYETLHANKVQVASQSGGGSSFQSAPPLF